VGLRPEDTGHDEEKANEADSEDDGFRGGNMEQDLSDLTEIPLGKFLEAVSDIRNLQTMSAKVDLSGTDDSEGKARANMLAEEIWERVNYQFMYALPSTSHISSPHNYEKIP
jgi:hypothetical protein